MISSKKGRTSSAEPESVNEDKNSRNAVVLTNSMYEISESESSPSSISPPIVGKTVTGNVSPNAALNSSSSSELKDSSLKNSESKSRNSANSNRDNRFHSQNAHHLGDRGGNGFMYPSNSSNFMGYSSTNNFFPRPGLVKPPPPIPFVNQGFPIPPSMNPIGMVNAGSMPMFPPNPMGMSFPTPIGRGANPSGPPAPPISSPSSFPIPPLPGTSAPTRSPPTISSDQMKKPSGSGFSSIGGSSPSNQSISSSVPKSSDMGGSSSTTASSAPEKRIETQAKHKELSPDAPPFELPVPSPMSTPPTLPRDSRDTFNRFRDPRFAVPPQSLPMPMPPPNVMSGFPQMGPTPLPSFSRVPPPPNLNRPAVPMTSELVKFSMDILGLRFESLAFDMSIPRLVLSIMEHFDIPSGISPDVVRSCAPSLSDLVKGRFDKNDVSKSSSVLPVVEGSQGDITLSSSEASAVEVATPVPMEAPLQSSNPSAEAFTPSGDSMEKDPVNKREEKKTEEISKLSEKGTSENEKSESLPETSSVIAANPPPSPLEVKPEIKLKDKQPESSTPPSRKISEGTKSYSALVKSSLPKDPPTSVPASSSPQVPQKPNKLIRGENEKKSISPNTSLSNVPQKVASKEKKAKDHVSPISKSQNVDEVSEWSVVGKDKHSVSAMVFSESPAYHLESVSPSDVPISSNMKGKEKEKEGTKKNQAEPLLAQEHHVIVPSPATRVEKKGRGSKKSAVTDEGDLDSLLLEHKHALNGSRVNSVLPAISEKEIELLPLKKEEKKESPAPVTLSSSPDASGQSLSSIGILPDANQDLTHPSLGIYQLDRLEMEQALKNTLITVAVTARRFASGSAVMEGRGSIPAPPPPPPNSAQNTRVPQVLTFTTEDALTLTNILLKEAVPGPLYAPIPSVMEMACDIVDFARCEYADLLKAGVVSVSFVKSKLMQLRGALLPLQNTLRNFGFLPPPSTDGEKDKEKDTKNMNDSSSSSNQDRGVTNLELLFLWEHIVRPVISLRLVATQAHIHASVPPPCTAPSSWAGRISPSRLNPSLARLRASLHSSGVCRHELMEAHRSARECEQKDSHLLRESLAVKPTERNAYLVEYSRREAATHGLRALLWEQLLELQSEAPWDLLLSNIRSVAASGPSGSVSHQLTAFAGAQRSDLFVPDSPAALRQLFVRSWNVLFEARCPGGVSALESLKEETDKAIAQVLPSFPLEQGSSNTSKDPSSSKEPSSPINHFLTSPQSISSILSKKQLLLHHRLEFVFEALLVLAAAPSSTAQVSSYSCSTLLAVAVAICELRFGAQLPVSPSALCEIGQHSLRSDPSGDQVSAGAHEAFQVVNRVVEERVSSFGYYLDRLPYLCVAAELADALEARLAVVSHADSPSLQMGSGNSYVNANVCQWEKWQAVGFPFFSLLECVEFNFQHADAFQNAPIDEADAALFVAALGQELRGIRLFTRRYERFEKTETGSTKRGLAVLDIDLDADAYGQLQTRSQQSLGFQLYPSGNRMWNSDKLGPPPRPASQAAWRASLNSSSHLSGPSIAERQPPPVLPSSPSNGALVEADFDEDEDGYVEMDIDLDMDASEGGEGETTPLTAHVRKNTYMDSISGDVKDSVSNLSFKSRAPSASLNLKDGKSAVEDLIAHAQAAGASLGSRHTKNISPSNTHHSSIAFHRNSENSFGYSHSGGGFPSEVMAQSLWTLGVTQDSVNSAKATVRGTGSVIPSSTFYEADSMV